MSGFSVISCSAVSNVILSTSNCNSLNAVDLKEIISSTPDSVNVKISLSSSAVSTFLSIFLSVKQILFSFNHFLAFLLEEEDDFVYTTIANIITPFYSELLLLCPIHYFYKTLVLINPDLFQKKSMILHKTVL